MARKLFSSQKNYQHKYQYQHNGGVGIATTLAIMAMLLLAFVSAYLSYIINEQEKNVPYNGLLQFLDILQVNDSEWISNLLLGFSASLFSVVPTFILFKLIVNRYVVQERKKLSQKKGHRDFLINSLNKPGLSINERQEFVDELKEYDLLQGYDVDLSYKDFTGLNFSNANFTSASLRNTKFKNITAINAHFLGAQISNADFSDAQLSGSTFERCSMRQTNFQNAELVNVNFNKAFIGESKLESADLRGATFREAMPGDNNVKAPSFNNETILPNNEKWKDGDDLSPFI